MGLKDFLSFEKFLTPSLVRVVYWIGLIALTIAELVALSQTFGVYGRGLAGAIVTLVGYAVALIFWRVICEGIMLSFRVFDRLTEIRDRLPRG